MTWASGRQKCRKRFYEGFVGVRLANRFYHLESGREKFGALPAVEIA